LFSLSGIITGTVHEHHHFAETNALEEAKYFALQNDLKCENNI
jgi:hypothetical protein